MIEIVSVHIPKTAGRSFLHILKEVYGENHVAHYEYKFYNEFNSPVSEFLSGLRPETSVIHGHFTVADLSGEVPEGAKYITWLRDPVERVISNYLFFKKRISENPHDEYLQNRKNESLMDYAVLENSRNRMSKFISGKKPEDFFYVGIMEQFEKSITKLAAKLQWPQVEIPKLNVRRETALQLSDDDYGKLVSLNSEDIELYNIVLSGGTFY